MDVVATIEFGEAYFRTVLAPYGYLAGDHWWYLVHQSLRCDEARGRYAVPCDPAIAKAWVRKGIEPIASPDLIQFTLVLPKTRSGKIMRRILRKIAEDEYGAPWSTIWSRTGRPAIAAISLSADWRLECGSRR